VTKAQSEKQWFSSQKVLIFDIIVNGNDLSTVSILSMKTCHKLKQAEEAGYEIR